MNNPRLQKDIEGSSNVENSNDIWSGDKLKRQVVAKYLGDYLTNKFSVSKESHLYDSFVLNINAEWGFGKSYLLKNWANELAAAGHPCVYFNAWETDFADDPLVAFIAEIENQLIPIFETPEKALLKSALTKGRKLLKPSIPILLSILTKHLTGMSMQEFGGALDDTGNIGGEQRHGSENSFRQEIVSTLISKSAEEALKEHKNHQKLVNDFRASLTKLTSRIESKDGKLRLPIFIFVDELDRCKPTYAIEILEHVKHIFGIRGVYFVAATDSAQLTHSIKAVYGSGFDGERYLRRFFDQEYTLPNPDHRAYGEYLISKHRLEGADIFVTGLSESLYKDGDHVTVLFSHFSQFFGLSLRDQEQCCLMLDAIRLTTPKGERLFLGYLLMLIMLRQVRRESFNRYERDLNWDAINQSVSEKTDKSVTLRSSVKDPHDNYGRSKQSSISMTALFRHYVEFANTPSEKLADGSPPSDEMFVALRKARIANPTDGLTSYVKRVARAGQFGIIDK